MRAVIHTVLAGEAIGWDANWDINDQFGRHLHFCWLDGNQAMREIVDAPGDTLIQIDSAIGTPIRADQLPSLLVNFLLAARFAHDELGIDYMAAEAGDRLYNAIKQLLPVTGASIDDPKDGGIYLFKIGHSAPHPGIYFNRQIWHCTDVSGVVAEPFALDRWYKRRAHNLRVLMS